MHPYIFHYSYGDIITTNYSLTKLIALQENSLLRPKIWIKKLRLLIILNILAIYIACLHSRSLTIIINCNLKGNLFCSYSLLVPLFSLTFGTA